MGGKCSYEVAQNNGHEACVEVLKGAVQIPIKTKTQFGGESGRSSVLEDGGASPALSYDDFRVDNTTPLLHNTDVAKPLDSIGEAATRDMCFAASKGNLKEVKRLLHKRADYNAKDYDSRTALHVAACGDHLSVVEFLFLQKAPLNVLDRWGHTPLEDAVTNNRTSVVTWLRKNGATQSGNSAVHRLCPAAVTGNLSKLESIESEGVDLNLANTDGRTALHLAASEGLEKTVEWLLNRGVNPSAVDRNGSTPLMEAQRARHSEVIKLLSGKGVHIRPPDHKIEL